MGELVDRIGLRMLVDGDGLVDNFKNNSNYFVQKFTKSDKGVEAIAVSDIVPGMFYHFHYLDTSNWMKWSPVFVTNHKVIGKSIIIFAVNFNFIPLEIRAFIFDKYMVEENFERNRPLTVSYQGMYDELCKFGYEYSLVEYDAKLIKLIHRIDMNQVPRFLISQHSQNKYDPQNLQNIWTTKLKTRDQRNAEIMKATLSDFFQITGELNDKYKVLKNHIQRIHNNQKKFGS